jgi:PAS domain S-box-containing protein
VGWSLSRIRGTGTEANGDPGTAATPNDPRRSGGVGDRPNGERRTRPRRRALDRRRADALWRTAPRVLVVAATVEGRLRYAALLEQAGYSAYAVADAIEALRTVPVRMPDAVLVGDGSSGRDSLALLAALRADAATRDMPAVVIASAQVEARGNGPNRQSGSTVLLGEPASIGAVIGAMDDLTGATRADRIAKRQLRRSMIAVRELLGNTIGEASDDDLECVINRVHGAMFGINADGSCIAISRGAEALTGYGRDELMGMSVFDSRLGRDLPLATAWEARTDAGRKGATTTIRDRAGRTVKVAFAIEAVTSHLHVLVLVPCDDGLI